MGSGAKFDINLELKSEVTAYLCWREGDDTVAPEMPSTADSPKAPHVPNHEMVRSIGRGSYGEIWLARSLTGTWRAVKIVDRRTFESDKAFQREFEGMAKFEPISREDAGFVDILHVGRDEAGDFFYYVMELGDDLRGRTPGRTPIRAGDCPDYRPRTLRDVISRHGALSVEECLDTIARSTGEAVDLSRIPFDDPDVFAEIQAGDTIGTFQIESRAQIQSIKRVKPENLHDLAIQVALIRPGPIVGQSTNAYVAFRERTAAWSRISIKAVLEARDG